MAAKRFIAEREGERQRSKLQKAVFGASKFQIRQELRPVQAARVLCPAILAYKHRLTILWDIFGKT